MCGAARGAVRNAQQNARFNKSAQQKKPCQPKTAKRFFGGSGSHGLSGQAKERMRILPVRRGVLRPARRAMCRAGRFCAACRCYAGFCARCPGAFSLLQPRRLCVRLPAGAPAFRGFVSRPAGSLPLLRLACAAGACLPFACHALVCAGLLLPLFGLFGSPRRSAGRCCRPASARKASCRCARIPQLCFRFAPGLRVLLPAAFARTFTAAVCLPSVRLCVRAFMLLSFALFLPHFCLSKFFSFVAHAATGTPFSFRKENGGKEPRGALPLRTPFQRPAADLPFPRAAGRLKRPFGPQTAGR